MMATRKAAGDGDFVLFDDCGGFHRVKMYGVDPGLLSGRSSKGSTVDNRRHHCGDSTDKCRRVRPCFWGSELVFMLLGRMLQKSAAFAENTLAWFV